MPRFLLQSTPDLRSKSLVLIKIWSLIIVFNLTFIAGTSPYLMKWNEGFILLGTQFAGGVFLGIALLQFLGDSNECFEKLSSRDYPFAFMLAISGYLLTMLADCLCVYVYRKRKSREAAAQQRKTTTNIASSSTGTSRSLIQVVDYELDHYVDPTFFSTSSFGDSILLIVMLSFHSVYEGITIGIAGTSSKAWRALWVVSLHKIFAAIAMGIALLRTLPDHPLVSCAAYSFVFAISTPIGVAIGIVIDSTVQGAVADWIYGIFIGISSGVFLYVSVNHLVSKGYSPQSKVSVDTPLHKFLAVLVGVAVIAIIMIWES
ncbi:zinc transporter 2-like isoform X1 [Apium graveolens]|uniref:zinc transporter 2-like isoform X1 n=2 Tax=Apium graveolens TaxID=4045 RepID=UPI003D7A6807